MIVDTLDNINQYKSLSANIYKGLKFIAKADRCDEHSPQHFFEQSERIKKVTIKVKIQINLLQEMAK